MICRSQPACSAASSTAGCARARSSSRARSSARACCRSCRPSWRVREAPVARLRRVRKAGHALGARGPADEKSFAGRPWFGTGREVPAEASRRQRPAAIRQLGLGPAPAWELGRVQMQVSVRVSAQRRPRPSAAAARQAFASTRRFLHQAAGAGLAPILRQRRRQGATRRASCPVLGAPPQHAARKEVLRKSPGAPGRGSLQTVFCEGSV